MQVTFHFDAMCPWTWLSSRWLLNAAGTEELDVRWAPFSLGHLNEGREIPEQYRAYVEAGRSSGRVVQHLLAIDDQGAIGRYYDELGDRVHRKGVDPSRDVVVEAATAAGLDDAGLAAADDESLDEAVNTATDLALAAAGPDIGSPVLHWTDDQAQDVWIFGPLFDRVPEPDLAAELWRGVRSLGVHASFKELKRGRHAEPDLANS